MFDISSKGEKDRSQIGIWDFVHNAIGLSDDDFEKAMRIDNNDEKVDDVIKSERSKAWTKDEIEAYGKL